MKIWRFLLLCCFALSLAAQSAPSPTVAKVHFSFDHPDLAVTHYDIDVDATGQAHYQSKIKDTEQGISAEGVSRDFMLSPETRDRLFQLVRSANELEGEFEYKKHKVAFTGTKTITLTDASGVHTAKFVWSENQNIAALAELFEGISATLEEEPVLLRLRKYDPLGLNAELGKMEKAADSGWLREIGLISGVLKDIATDPSIMGLARKRAEHLLQKAAVSNRNET